MPTTAKRGRPPAANPPDTSIHLRCTKRARGLIKLAAEAAGVDMTAYLLNLAWTDIQGGRSLVKRDEAEWSELVAKKRVAKTKRLRELVDMRLVEQREDKDGLGIWLVWRRPLRVDIRPF